jgi:hypothetical protein
LGPAGCAERVHHPDDLRPGSWPAQGTKRGDQHNVRPRFVPARRKGEAASIEHIVVGCTNVQPVMMRARLGLWPASTPCRGVA